MISILLPDLRGGGAERVMIDLAREFTKLGHKVEFVLTNAIGDFLPEAARDFRVIDLSAARIRNVLYPLARYINESKPRVVIANMWPLTSVSVLARVFARHRCKLLLVEHNTLSRQYATWGNLHSLKLSLSMTLTYPFADLIAAVSEGAALDTIRLSRLASNRVKVLYNPIPQRRMPSLEIRRIIDSKWHCPPGKRIITVGSLKDQKNHPLLLRAFAKMRRSDAHLMILGQGNNEAMLRSLTNALGIAERVTFAGFHKDPTPFYATADLFVLSSDYEGLPTVLIEALSFGLSVVSTDCPSGPVEILENGRWGKLTPVGNAEALAQAMDEALSTPVDREALKRRAADFSPEIAAQQYLKFLNLE